MRMKLAGRIEVDFISKDVASCQVQECSVKQASSQGFIECLLDFLASLILLKPLNIKLSWYTLQNLKFLFLWLPCRSLYSPSGRVVQLSLNTPDTVCFSCQRKWCSWSEGWWEANIQATFIPRPDSKGLCDLRNYPSRASLFPESETTGQCGLVCLHPSGVCSIAPVTLSHRAVGTALWGATVQGGREGSVALRLEWVDPHSNFSCAMLALDCRHAAWVLQSLVSLSLKWEQ